MSAKLTAALWSLTVGSVAGASLLNRRKKKKLKLKRWVERQLVKEGIMRRMSSSIALPGDGMPKEQLMTMRRILSRNRQYRSLLEVTRDISGESRLEEAMDRIINAASVIVRCDRVTLFTVDSRKGEMRVAASKGTSLDCHDGIGGVRIPLDRTSIAGYVAHTGSTLNIRDAYDDPRFDNSMDVKTGYRTRTLLCMAVRDSTGAPVAVIQAINKIGSHGSSPPFTDEDEFLLSHIADFAGSLLHRLGLFEVSLRSRKRMEGLLDMIGLVSQELETDKVIQKILDVSYRLLRAERMALFLVDEEKRELLIASSKDAEGVRIPFGKGIAGYCAEKGELVNVRDAYEDPRFDASVDRDTGFHTRSLLCMPVADAEGRIIAVVQAINRIDLLPFDEDDATMLRYIAANAGIALRKAQLFQQSQEARNKTEALLELVRAVAEEEDLSQLVLAVINAGYRIVDADRIALFLVDHVKQELWLAVSKDVEQGVRIPFGAGLAGWVAKTGEELNIADAYADERFDSTMDSATGYRTRSVLCLPVYRPGTDHVVAVMQAINKRGVQPFGVEDKSALTAFCAEVGHALQRRSQDAALVKLLNDNDSAGGISDSASSLVQLYTNDAATELRRVLEHRSRRVMARTVSWPKGLSSEAVRSRKWGLDILNMSPDTMVHDVVEMFKMLGLLRRFKLAEERFCNFVMSVRVGGYQDNPFHSFYHGFHVLYSSFYMLTCTPAGTALTFMDTLATLLAALCHDLDHPGHNNTFEMNTLSPLALMHNDDAILERHHAHQTFLLLNEEGNDFLSAFSPSDFRTVRKTIIGAILATDMSRHFDHCKELDKLPSENAFQRDNPEHRTLLVNTIVHAADLAGQAQPRDICLAWGERVLEEFQAQAEKEEHMGLPVTPFMKGLDSPLKRHQLQLNFINYVVSPLWSNVARLFPALQPCLDHLMSNRDWYAEEVEALQLAAKEEAAAAAAAGEGGAAAAGEE